MEMRRITQENYFICEKKGSNIVESVDIKCGNQDRAWASPITNCLKKLGFLKLSESII